VRIVAVHDIVVPHAWLRCDVTGLLMSFFLLDCFCTMKFVYLLVIRAASTLLMAGVLAVDSHAAPATEMSCCGCVPTLLHTASVAAEVDRDTVLSATAAVGKRLHCCLPVKRVIVSFIRKQCLAGDSPIEAAILCQQCSATSAT
jgi:hypothetical protein